MIYFYKNYFLKIEKSPNVGDLKKLAAKRLLLAASIAKIEEAEMSDSSNPEALKSVSNSMRQVILEQYVIAKSLAVQYAEDAKLYGITIKELKLIDGIIKEIQH